MTFIIPLLLGLAAMVIAARLFGAAGYDNDPDLSLSSALAGWAAACAAIGLFILTGVLI